MTRQEKLAIYFLTAMLALGLAVKCYKAVTSQVVLKVENASLPQDSVGIKKIIKEKTIVKINSASREDFNRLSGIGPALAERIVHYRDKNGAFASIEGIKNVAGIGDKKYEAIKDYLALE